MNEMEEDNIAENEIKSFEINTGSAQPSARLASSNHTRRRRISSNICRLAHFKSRIDHSIFALIIRHARHSRSRQDACQQPREQQRRLAHHRRLVEDHRLRPLRRRAPPPNSIAARSTPELHCVIVPLSLFSAP
jgi:hypothetical protein